MLTANFPKLSINNVSETVNIPLKSVFHFDFIPKFGVKFDTCYSIEKDLIMFILAEVDSDSNCRSHLMKLNSIEDIQCVNSFFFLEMFTDFKIL